MAADWDFYALRVDGDPASIFVDLDLDAAAPIEALPNVAYLRIRMNAPRPDGLSSQEEYDALIAIEDTSTGALSNGTTCLYVGRNTSSGNRDFYFYVSDIARFEANASACMKPFSNYQFQTGGRFDPEWSTYHNFLYPPARDLQRMMNRRVCESLEAQGDDLELLREIDHHCYLPTAALASELAQLATAQGFTVKAIHEPWEKNPMFEVHLMQFARPRDIDEPVLLLFEACSKLGGEYDGWGCVAAGAPGAS
ncbi:MAG: DUF695 domain-containing protein [Hyphomonas sp.]|uniref:DUF695 domain-containing protein n=1 Tax=Hyphomonas sp. TaxID=87 RepID=UPI00182E510A|nr:DUF695 domain-containing protein [Hyphomonas sp.]MBA3067181.1 DUF695 domain-containing protein [Hyphomonas sp.]MBU3920501.1 DUF695 domain-containing protein [Alphaproteobacteria bacterium]MBU4061209.1 DUF695 domain-containing protein [Alphaproteobacteria bacterium]MBU4165121.1 DUF695 domain-containing protein [Alphaproteobacteria bacterium]